MIDYDQAATDLRAVFGRSMDRIPDDVFGLHAFDRAVDQIVDAGVDLVALRYGEPDQWLPGVIRELADRDDHRSRMLARRLSDLAPRPG